MYSDLPPLSIVGAVGLLHSAAVPPDIFMYLRVSNRITIGTVQGIITMVQAANTAQLRHDGSRARSVAKPWQRAPVI